MRQARIAIHHKDCWGSRLVENPHVRDVKFWTGLKVDSERVLGSMVVRADREIDVMKYNPYDLEYVVLDETRLSDWEIQYTVEFIVVCEDDHPPVVSLLFESGCLFEPPALVQGEYELQTVLAPKLENLQQLINLLKSLGRDFQILSLRESETDHWPPTSVSWSNILTPKQLNAIQIAFKHGFYRYPRNIRISDLAEEANVARSTFQEHLRLAEMKLIRYLMNGEGEDGESNTNPPGMPSKQFRSLLESSKRGGSNS